MTDGSRLKLSNTLVDTLRTPPTEAIQDGEYTLFSLPLNRDWIPFNLPPNLEADTHTHPFDIDPSIFFCTAVNPPSSTTQSRDGGTRVLTGCSRRRRSRPVSSGARTRMICTSNSASSRASSASFASRRLPPLAPSSTECEQPSPWEEAVVYTNSSLYSHDLRKSIARVLTVINAKQRSQLRLFYKNKKYAPLDLRPKQTRAIRRRLSPAEKARVLEKTKKHNVHFPQRKFAIKVRDIPSLVVEDHQPHRRT